MEKMVQELRAVCNGKHMDTESEPSVNRLHGHSGKPKYKAENSKTTDQKYRCGKSGHFARNMSFPARDITCKKCVMELNVKLLLN